MGLAEVQDVRAFGSDHGVLGPFVDGPRLGADEEFFGGGIDVVDAVPEDWTAVFDEAEGQTDLVHDILRQHLGVPGLGKVEGALEHGDHLDYVGGNGLLVFDVVFLLFPYNVQKRTNRVRRPFVNIRVNLDVFVLVGGSNMSFALTWGLKIVRWGFKAPTTRGFDQPRVRGTITL